MDNVNTKNDPNSEMNTASLHDVPLSNEDQEDTVQGPIEKIPSKNGSLKRFFKLHSSKKSGSHEGGINVKNVEADADVDADNEEELANNEKNKEDDNAMDNEQAAVKAQNLGRVRSRRFNFRFGNNNTEGDVPTSSNNAPTQSRHSLRSSLSTYFNSVFKRKQGASSKHTLRTSKKKDSGEQEDDGNENSIEMVEQKLVASEQQEQEDEKTKVGNKESTDTIEQHPPMNLSASGEITPTATPPPQEQPQV